MAATGTEAGSHLSSKIRVTCAAVVFLAALALYVRTLAPTVTLVDSGELIVAAHSLGVAHPPGFPLYVLLAHIASIVPISSIAVRVNFASALFAALAASVMTLALLEAMRRVQIVANRAARKTERGKKGKKPGLFAQTTGDFTGQSRTALVAACLVSGLLLAFSRTLWAYATIAEVYTLNALLILIVFLLMFRWRRKVTEAKMQRSGSATRPEGSKTVETVDGDLAGKDQMSRPTTTSPSYGSLYAAAFVFGLALGVHHVTVGLMLPALAALVLATEGFSFFSSKRLLYAALFAFVGLSIYVYLPLAASQSPIMNWGDPRTLERFWWHVTGRQYQVFFSPSLETAFRQLGGLIKIAAREFGPWWLPLAAVLAITGLADLLGRDKGLFWFLLLVIFADLTYSLGYEIAEDKDAYYLPAFIAATIAAGFGAAWFIDNISFQRFSSATVRNIIAALVLLVPVAALVGNFSYNNRSAYFIAEDYAGNILSTMEPDGMLLTRDWQVYSPMLYVHELEHRREDAVIIDINQLRRSWYFDYLARAYPSTIEQAREQVDAFLEDLRHWEHDPDLYQRDLSLNQRINSRFYEMILAFVANHIRSAPVYVTLDIAANRDAGDSDLTKSLAGSYQFLPQGLIFQLATAREFQQPSDPQLKTRGLTDGATLFEDDDVVKLKVLPVYVTMLYNRGRYLAAYGRHEQAIDLYKRALDLDPRFSIAQQAINESMSAIRKGSTRTLQ